MRGTVCKYGSVMSVVNMLSSSAYVRSEIFLTSGIPIVFTSMFEGISCAPHTAPLYAWRR